MKALARRLVMPRVMAAEMMNSMAEKGEDTMRDPYLEWVARQDVPVVEDFGIDIRKVPVKPWARYGMHGAFCHLKGRDDFLSIFAFELPPGGKSAPLRHICEDTSTARAWSRHALPPPIT
jgi:hypothetical protein